MFVPRQLVCSDAEPHELCYENSQSKDDHICTSCGDMWLYACILRRLRKLKTLESWNLRPMWVAQQDLISKAKISLLMTIYLSEQSKKESVARVKRERLAVSLQKIKCNNEEYW